MSAEEQTLFAYASDRVSGKNSPITPALESILEEIVHDGVPYYSWSILKQLLIDKMVSVIDTFNSQFGNAGGVEERKEALVSSLRGFEAAPFTLQRLCEVLVEPTQYQATHKLLNGLEKILSVSSTIPRKERPQSNGTLTSTIEASSMETEQMQEDGSENVETIASTHPNE